MLDLTPTEKAVYRVADCVLVLAFVAVLMGNIYGLLLVASGLAVVFVVGMVAALARGKNRSRSDG